MTLYGIRVASLSGLFLLTAYVAYSSCNCICDCDGDGYDDYGGRDGSMACNNSQKWIAAEDGAVPENAVSIHYDLETTVGLYVARVSCGNNILPAELTTNPNTSSQALAVFNNMRLSFRKYEVLSNIHIDWEDVRNGTLPSNAIVVGYCDKKIWLYVGQVYSNGTFRIGTVNGNTGQLSIAMDHGILYFSTYEIMVYPNRTRHDYR